MWCRIKNQELRIKDFMNREKIQSFTDLLVWQKGHRAVLEIYKITQKFPQEEKFGLVVQLRRAAVSITSNIAEGFSRSHYKDKTKFYGISLGSLTEVQNQLLIARDMGYFSKADFDCLAQKTIEISKMLNGLIKVSKQRICS